MLDRMRFALVVTLLLVGGCASLPPGADYPRQASTALANPETTRLGRHFAEAARRHPGTSGFRLISAGADGFLIRMQLIQAAQKTLDLQYFIFRGDETGRLLTDAVLKAADRGVRVRLLIDDGETVPGDEQVTRLAAHPSIEIRIFNPFAYRGHVKLIRALEFALNASRLDYRMHNKLLVVDNAVALVGGRNIGDRYFQIAPGSQFADDDVFAAGPVVRRLSASFDDYWRSPLSIPVAALDHEADSARQLQAARARLARHKEQLAAEAAPYLQRVAGGEPLAGILGGSLPLAWASAQVIYDSPDKKQVDSGAMLGRLMHRAVADAARAVHAEWLLVTPFLIPGREGMQLIEDLRRRGVRVRILTNSLESSPVLVAQAGYMHYRMPLLEAGVELYEVRSRPGNSQGSGQTMALSRYGNYSLHAKLFVFDRQRLFVGSMNFDQRSMHLNTEIGLIIDSPELARQAAARFEAMVQPANAYRLELVRRGPDQPPTLAWHTSEGGADVTYLQEPAHSDEQRSAAKALSVLPVDDEL